MICSRVIKELLLVFCHALVLLGSSSMAICFFVMMVFKSYLLILFLPFVMPFVILNIYALQLLWNIPYLR